MKPASPALQALLSTSQFFMADLYTFTLIDSTVVALTTAEAGITANGVNFLSVGPYIERGSVKWKLGLEVDTLDLTIYPEVTNLVDGQPFSSSLRVGAFDGAEVTLDRAFMATWGDTSAGVVRLFDGRVGEITAGRTKAKITVNSHLELLSQQMPRNIYTPGCQHTLFDIGCTLSKAAFTVTETCGTGATATNVPISGSHADGYFALGTCTFTSGANIGITRTIKGFAGNVMQMLVPLPNIPASGDTIAVTAGCDKSQTTCTSKFSNFPNFRGFPYIPVAETAQ